MKRNIIYTILAFVSVLLVNSCRHKPLAFFKDKTETINVVIDWKCSPDANPKPKSMRVLLYPIDGYGYIPQQFPNHTGGLMSRVPSGKYHAICYNDDLENVKYTAEDNFTNFKISGSTNSLNLRSFRNLPRTKASEDQRVSNLPDKMLYTDVLEEVEILPNVPNQTITFCPKMPLWKCTVIVKNIKNLEYVTPNNMKLTLTGMAGGMYIHNSKPDDELVTIPFSFEKVSDTEIKAQFYCFGFNKELNKLHDVEFVIYAINEDGRKGYVSTNVSEQINNAPNPKDVVIEIDGIELPKPIISEHGGALEPSIDDWGEPIYIDLPMTGVNN